MPKVTSRSKVKYICIVVLNDLEDGEFVGGIVLDIRSLYASKVNTESKVNFFCCFG